MGWFRGIDREQVVFDFIITNHEEKYDYEDEVLALGGRIIRAPSFHVKKISSLASWWDDCFAAHEEWSVVHCHDPLSGSICLTMAKKHGRVPIAHSHFSTPDQGLDGLIRRLARWPLRHVAQVRLACSSPAGRWMFGNRPGTAYVRNGINLAKHSFDPEQRQEVRRDLGVEEAFLVGHIGRFVPVKNHEKVLTVFAELLRREPRARLILVGDGPLRQQAERQIAQLGLERHVIMTGKRDDIPDLTLAMDVLLLPSHSEGLPVTVIEAQASGLPCVVSDVVTPEVKVTNLVRFLELDQGDDVWADVALATKKLTPRLSRIDELRSAGYDSAQTARDLQRMYLELDARQRGRKM